MLENIVFLELKRRGKKIYYHRGNHECDFIIEKAIQVTKKISNDNKERELKGIIETSKKGIILTYDQEDTIEDIPLIPIWKWLLDP